jgi:hypothetical protein
MRSFRSVLAGVAALAVAGCATTTFNSTWKNPEAQAVTLDGQKVVALVVSKNESSRRGAEEALARELNKLGVQGVPAYTLLPTEQVRDKEQAKAAFEKAGAQGVVVMRVIGQEKELTSTPGGWYGAPGYGSFWGGGGYWGYGWGAVYDPGYLRTDTIVSVETLVYSLKHDKLVWAGRSETTNPSKADDFVRELTAGAVKEMKKVGLIRSA